MKIKEYLIIIIILLVLSILFIPIEKTGIAVGIAISALILAVIYWYIKKK